MLAISAAQGIVVLAAAVLRPFTSTILNVLEAACGVLDTGTLVLAALVYKTLMQQEGQQQQEGEEQQEGGSFEVSCRLHTT
jgi:hypothetical protein